MITHQQIQDWYEHHFGHMKNANTQNAIAELHGILGTDKPQLEDKLTGGDLKKITEGDA
jgi:hypothetical protein